MIPLQEYVDRVSYFSVEFEGEGDPIIGTEKLVEESLKYL